MLHHARSGRIERVRAVLLDRQRCELRAIGCEHQTHTAGGNAAAAVDHRAMQRADVELVALEAIGKCRGVLVAQLLAVHAIAQAVDFLSLRLARDHPDGEETPEVLDQWTVSCTHEPTLAIASN